MSVFSGGPYGRLAIMLNALSSLNIEINIIIIIVYFSFIHEELQRRAVNGTDQAELGTPI